MGTKKSTHITNCRIKLKIRSRTIKKECC